QRVTNVEPLDDEIPPAADVRGLDGNLPHARQRHAVERFADRLLHRRDDVRIANALNADRESVAHVVCSSRELSGHARPGTHCDAAYAARDGSPGSPDRRDWACSRARRAASTERACSTKKDRA